MTLDYPLIGVESGYMRWPILKGCHHATLYFLQIERDALIWGSKRYVSKPILVKEDQLILAHRRWFSQFYSENSVKFSLEKEEQYLW